MRRVTILSLAANGDVEETRRLVPARAPFDEAFAAFARGTLFSTDRGPVAVEDLLPGDNVRTSDGYETLLWKGATPIVPGAKGQDPAMGYLTRIAADALGIARPMPDLVLGPKARMVHRGPGIRTLTGSDKALVPASDFTDGVNIVALAPATPVECYHLAFDVHCRMTVHGVEVESFHPGPSHLLGLGQEQLGLYLSCFSHVERLEDFGASLYPRLRLGDLNLFEAG